MSMLLRRYHKRVPVASPEATKPSKDAKKSEWVAYAGSLGLDTDGLTVSDLKDAVAAREMEIEQDANVAAQEAERAEAERLEQEEAARVAEAEANADAQKAQDAAQAGEDEPQGAPTGSGD